MLTCVQCNDSGKGPNRKKKSEQKSDQLFDFSEGAKRHKNWVSRLGEDTTQLSLVKGER